MIHSTKTRKKPNTTDRCLPLGVPPLNCLHYFQKNSIFEEFFTHQNEEGTKALQYKNTFFQIIRLYLGIISKESAPSLTDPTAKEHFIISNRGWSYKLWG